MVRRGENNNLLVDFAIITAVKTEREAICRAFNLTDHHKVRRGTRVYWRGRLQLQNESFYEIVVVQSPGAASVDASLVTSDTIHHWSPGALLLVGFAGAAHDGTRDDDEALGDLIIGSDVYYYEGGKETENGRLPEPQMYKPNATLWNNVVSAPEWRAPILARRPDRKRVRPKIIEGVIASGERVIASAAIRDAIVNNHRKIRAIEMEGYGFSKAAWASVGSVPHLVMKAICDRADREKADDWQPYAAAVAASFAKHFLLDCPLEPRNPSQTDNRSTGGAAGSDIEESRQRASRRETDDWEVDLPKINYTNVFPVIDEIFEKIKDRGTALFLIQDSSMMGGEWCAAHIRDILRRGSRKFKHCRVEFFKYQRLTEHELMIKVGSYLNIKRPSADLQQYIGEVIDELCGSLQVGSTLFIELRIWDDLSQRTDFLYKLVNEFWKPLVRKITNLGDHASLAKVVFLILANSPLSRLCMDPSIFCTRRDFDQEKILELQLEKWKEEEIRTWLYRFSRLELASSEYDQMASSIYRSSTNGLPIVVYSLLLDSFAQGA